MSNEEDCCFQCQEPGHITWHCPHIRCYECDEYGHVIMDCPHKIPPSGTPVTHHKAHKGYHARSSSRHCCDNKENETGPDYRPTHKDISVWVTMICTVATLDHNSGRDTATTETAHDDISQHTADTATDLNVTHWIGHIVDYPHITALEVINPEMVVGHTNDHPTDLQGMNQADQIHTPAGQVEGYTQKEHEHEDRRTTHLLLQLRWSFQWLWIGIRFFKLIEPSPSSDSHKQGGLSSSNQVTMALIPDCPTIMVHAGNCYKAIIDSGAAISLIRYSTYQTINSFKTSIQTNMTELNTEDGSPMTALGMMTFQLRIADFKFADNFIIPDMKILFGIDIQKKVSLSYACDKEKEPLHTEGWQISHLHQTLWTGGNYWNCQVNSQNTTQTHWHNLNQDQRIYN